MTMDGAVKGAPRWMLRLEGLIVLIGCLIVYQHHASEGWGLFALLFFVPDLGMVGYLAGPRVGAASYNALHSYLVPVIIGAFYLSGVAIALAGALIWAAHIGFDRMLGFGLKYPEGFAHTHLGAVGRKSVDG